VFLIVLEYAILASTFTIAKQALTYAPPFFLIAVRLLSAGTILTLFSFAMRSVDIKKVARDWHLFLQVALFHAYFAFIPEFWALQRISSIKTSIIYALTPFVAALLSFLFYKEVLSPKKWLGLIVGFVGLLPLVALQAAEHEITAFLFFSFEELVLLFAVCSASYAWFVIKKLMQKGNSLVFINGSAMLLGGVASAATALACEGYAWQQVAHWQPFVLSLTLLIILSHIISYNLYSYLLTRYSITFMTFCGFLCPLFSTLFGTMFLGEMVHWHHLAALGGVVVGLALFTHDGNFHA